MTDAELSARNVALVQEIYERYARGDRAALYDALAPDIRWSSVGDGVLPWAGTRTGPDGVRSYLSAIDAVAERVDHAVEQVIAQGEWIAVLGTLANRDRRTGQVHRYAKADFVRVVDGRIADYREFYDTAQACRDFGFG